MHARKKRATVAVMGGARPELEADDFIAAVTGRLDRALRDRCPQLPWRRLRGAIASGKVRVDGRVVVEDGAVVPAGARITVIPSAPGPRASARRLDPSAIVHVDPHLVVVRKPAGVSTVPYADGEEGTLVQLVARELGRVPSREGRRGGAPPQVVHRLDKATSGLLVFARTLEAKRGLQQLFRRHDVERRYLAIASGAVSRARFESRLVKDRGDGRRGSTRSATLGRLAVTHVLPLEQLAGATLVECRLETGRTHQIRIHLSEAGHPLAGEPVYSKGWEGVLVSAPRLMLHAAVLGFRHPVRGDVLRFEAPPPPDFRTRLEQLRRLAGGSEANYVGRPSRE